MSNYFKYDKEAGDSSYCYAKAPKTLKRVTMLFLKSILESRNKWLSKALYVCSNIGTPYLRVSQYSRNFCIVIAAQRGSDLEKQCLTTKKLELVCQKKLKHAYYACSMLEKF